MSVLTIRPLDRPDPRLGRVAKANEFSLHALVDWVGELGLLWPQRGVYCYFEAVPGQSNYARFRLDNGRR
jgi:hypothetical protein